MRPVELNGRACELVVEYEGEDDNIEDEADIAVETRDVATEHE